MNDTDTRTIADIQASLAELREAFPDSQVGTLPGRGGGPPLSYVGHAAVTDRLLKVDPFWTWEPMGVDQHGLPARDADGNLWIRLTVCGVTRIGVGDSGNGKGAKEAIGDALRNAAMRFGVALDLWSKQDLQDSAEARGPVAPPPPAAHVVAVRQAIANLPEDLRAELRAWYDASGFGPVDGLDPSQAQGVLAYASGLKQDATADAQQGAQDPR